MLNAYPLGHDVAQLDLWAARGMRMFGFSYTGNNDWADSSRPLPFFNDTADALGGLSPLGEQAVKRLNDLGVIIDVSQMSTRPWKTSPACRAHRWSPRTRRPGRWWTSHATSPTTRCS
jgi:microsomal dipeptidase-like Zn-dependent dipeptidase